MSAKAARKKLLGARDVSRAVREMAGWIGSRCPDPSSVGIVGIRSRGAPLAERLAAALGRSKGWQVTAGALDISFHRDDLSTKGPNLDVRSTSVPFDVTGREVVLVDDVLYTGRTVRAAMEQVIAFGRPRAIRLLVLVDRGHREYPIRADYAFLVTEVPRSKVVRAYLKETDGRDEVVIEASRG